MTIEELRDRLDEMVERGYGDEPINVALQPNYPLTASIVGTVHLWQQGATIVTSEATDYASTELWDMAE